MKQLLERIELQGRANNLLITIVDRAPNFYRVKRRGSDDDIFHVEVGCAFDRDYPPEDDVLVIQLLEEKLKQVIGSDPAFVAGREELLRIITNWTTAAMGA